MATFELRSEVTGSVWEITAQVGQTLAPGDTMMVLESMKMEIPVLCEDGGTVTQILVVKGDSVAEGQSLAVLSS